MTWLAREPSGLVRACLATLPRLEAEEAIASTKGVAFGTGSMSDHDAAAMARYLTMAANPEPPRKALNANALRAAGIAIRRAKRTKPPAA